MKRRFDYAIVGGGVNALVAAAVLSKKGRTVALFEANDRVGGCLRTEELTEPGFLHDTLAATFTLFVTGPAHAELAADLEKKGVSLVAGPAPTGVLLPDGRYAILRTDAEANREAFEAHAAGDGDALKSSTSFIEQNAPLLFSLLGGPAYGSAPAKALIGAGLKSGPRRAIATLGSLLHSSRDWLEGAFESDEARAIFAPWSLHAGLGPEAILSGGIAQVIAFALQGAGAPISIGGAAKVSDALAEIATEHGAAIETGARVERIVVERGKAQGVTLANGRTIRTRRGVIASVPPRALYQDLLADAPDLDEARNSAKRFRHGRADMQIHYALDGPPDWGAEPLGEVSLLHLTAGVNAVSKAVNEAERGLLPETPTVCVGQPHVVDPSRCPTGKAVLWLQLLELPRRIAGDAAGVIDAPADGRWTPEIGEQYADRVETILRSSIRNFDAIRLARAIRTPADLEALNSNLVGGDPYGGAAGLDQSFLFRPFPDSVNDRTPIKNLYHIGASTHPGPGLGGGSGFMAGSRL